MNDLAALQRQFAAAMLDPSAPLPPSLQARGKNAPQRRFALYRNNIVTSLVSALVARFPVVHRLVGDEFFRAMARRYVAAAPPRSPVLLLYGESFPDFIGSFAPAASIEYLADVARLEFARGRAYHAADAVPIDPGAFAHLRPAELANLRMVFHPSVALVDSPFPIVSIWESHQQAEVAAIQHWRPETALVARPALDVEIWRLPPAGGVFIGSLAHGERLSSAAERATAASVEFDPILTLSVLLRANIVIALRREPATVS